MLAGAGAAWRPFHGVHSSTGGQSGQNERPVRQAGRVLGSENRGAARAAGFIADWTGGAGGRRMFVPQGRAVQGVQRPRGVRRFSFSPSRGSRIHDRKRPGRAELNTLAKNHAHGLTETAPRGGARRLGVQAGAGELCFLSRRVRSQEPWLDVCLPLASGVRWLVRTSSFTVRP